MKLTSAEIKTGLAIEPQASVAAVVTGVEIDRKGYNSAVFTALVGTTTSSPSVQSCSFQVKESDTSGGSFADVTDGTSVIAITADSTGGEINLDLRPLKRYVKVVCTITFTGGTTPAIEVACSYSLGEAKVKPAS